MRKHTPEINLIITYMAAAGDGISGGTRIHTECTKHWLRDKRFKTITVITSDDGARACIRNGVPAKNVIMVSTLWSKKINFWFDYGVRIIRSVIFATVFKLRTEKYIVYSASDFWADFFPALILKLRYRHSVKLISALYLSAPAPWTHDNPYRGRFFFKGLLYWLSQTPVYILIRFFADSVCVTSEPDVKRFITGKRNASNIIVVQGGVDITESEKYLKSNVITPVKKRKYDACYVGRFHHQKGVLELIDIWRLVCKRRKNARLVMVGLGSGSLDTEIQQKIKKHHLQNNIDLYEFWDGEKKYSLFKNTKMILHPAIYDSGGMAAAEAMAWGLPGVSFNLESLKTYYPKGMLKAPVHNNKQFANLILRLLTNESLYRKVSRDAHSLITETWDWNKRTKIIADKFLQNYAM